MNTNLRKALPVIALVVFVAHASAQTTKKPTLKVPEGFIVEQVAGPKLTRYPMLGAFDDQGRLYVCESIGENLDAQQLLKRLPNFIRRLEDTNGDGRFDKSSIFADKLTIPTGIMFHDGAIYVANPPGIVRLEDSNGDGKADKRDELVRGFKFRGHAGDVHGPYLAPNGRLFFVDGFMGHELRDKEGKLLSKGRASRVFSTKLNGDDLQTFAGGGMANLSAATFNESGECFGVSTFFHYDSRRVREDGFFHTVYGGVYPRQLSLLRAEFKISGPLLPPLRLFGMSAPANLTAYRSGAFGKDYLGNIFIAHFNTRTVSRSRLTKVGATYRADYEPFLTTTNPDFHPCDVIEDADGSLVVINTGGWFKIGCPTSHRQPNVLGGIYRIRRRNHVSVNDPRGLKLNWKATKQLVRALGDARFAVRRRAIAELVKRSDAIAWLQASKFLTSASELARKNAVLVLTRIGTKAALALARQALHNPAEMVRLAACDCAATHRDQPAVPLLIELLNDEPAMVRRRAAEALGRIGNQSAVRPLLKLAARSGNDLFLSHAVTYALIEIAAPNPTRHGLSNKSPSARRAALIALDQMASKQGYALTKKDIVGVLKGANVQLAEAVVDVVTRKPEWYDTIHAQLIDWLSKPKSTPQRLALLRRAVYALRRNARLQAAMADGLTSRRSSVSCKRMLLSVMVDSGFAKFPPDWQQALSRLIESSSATIVREALNAMGSTTKGQFRPVLKRFVQNRNRPVAGRVQALRILAKNRGQLSDQAFQLLRRQLTPEADYQARMDAAHTLGLSKLDARQRAAVIQLVAEAGPVELPSLLNVATQVWQAKDSPQQPRQLLNAIARAPGFPSLTEGQVKSAFAKAPEKMRGKAAALVIKVKTEYASSIREVLRTSFSVVGGNAQRGKEIFHSKRTLCSECHRTKKNGAGKDIGPDLSRIGRVRSHRDLLESILLPSQSFARGYEPKVVVTKSGQIHVGVVRNDNGDSMTLYTEQRKQIRLAKREVSQVTPGKTSIMPRGLARQLTSNDIRDLLAYLKSLDGR